jgi:hypothetical protein
LCLLVPIGAHSKRTRKQQPSEVPQSNGVLSDRHDGSNAPDMKYPEVRIRRAPPGYEPNVVAVRCPSTLLCHTPVGRTTSSIHQLNVSTVIQTWESLDQCVFRALIAKLCAAVNPHEVKWQWTSPAVRLQSARARRPSFMLTEAGTRNWFALCASQPDEPAR